MGGKEFEVTTEKKHTMKKVLVVLLVLYLVGASGPKIQEASLFDQLRCPVCDYAVSHITKQMLSWQRQCHDTTDASEQICERPVKVGSEAKGVTSIRQEAVEELLVLVCNQDILRVFPAVLQQGGRASKKANDGTTIEEDDLNSIAPLGRTAEDAIKRVCHGALSKRSQQDRALIHKFLYVETQRAVDGVPNATVSVRQMDYTAIVTLQMRICGKVCGPIRRPDTLEDVNDTDRVAFNVFGKNIPLSHI